MQIVTSFSSSVTFHLLTLRLFPPLPIFYLYVQTAFASYVCLLPSRHL